MTRPNFVMVVADQLRADALGTFGRAARAKQALKPTKAACHLTAEHPA